MTASRTGGVDRWTYPEKSVGERARTTDADGTRRAVRAAPGRATPRRAGRLLLPVVLALSVLAWSLRGALGAVKVALEAMEDVALPGDDETAGGAS